MSKTVSYKFSSFNPLSGGRAAAPLGILPNNRPAYSRKGSRVSGSNAVLSELSGPVVLESDLTDSLILRYVRQSAARRLLPQNRVSWCLRRSTENELPTVVKDRVSGSAHWGGLMSCGRAWECPVCAAKISQRRREELSLMVSQHRAAGGSLFMVTYTFAHTRFDDLADTMKRLEKARAALVASRGYKELKASVEQIGTVRALEITHGHNGWHPHFHEIWFCNGSVDHLRILTAIKSRMFSLWLYQCRRAGLGEPNEKHGVDVRDASFVSSYASKWGIEDEMTKHNAKKARAGGLSPFQLLSEYIDGDKQAGALFREFVTVFKGKRQLHFSKGLRALFDLSPEKTDEEIAAEETSSGDILGQFTLEQWGALLRSCSSRRDVRPEILRLAESGGWPVVYVFCHSLAPGQFSLSAIADF